MFGYEKGAFTGAVERRPGEFERAAGGTLFLDEIGELPLAMQPKLLRVLQEREARRLGGSRPVKLDIRIIAAANRNLQAGFRSDLYYRLNVISIRTPALRDRPEDILPLARHFAGRRVPSETIQLAREHPRIAECHRARGDDGFWRMDQSRRSCGSGRR